MSQFLPGRRFFLTLVASVITTVLFAQTRLTGRVTDGKDGIPGASIAVKGRITGTITDGRGNFSLTVNTPPPFTIAVSSVGFATQEIEVTGSRELNVALQEKTTLGEEVVVSASRVEESVLKSPVTVEKMDIRAIQNAPASNFYESLQNIKGIDMATQGFLFRSVNMRGFGATGNVRTVQMIDGMDNQAPGLNFPVDNIVGMPELDVESVEILPGAASALYGPNAINGLILMNSKSPFLYQGLSANVKTGIMSASNRDVVNTGFYDASIRYAKAFNNKFAFKTNFSLIQAKDWQATDYTNLNVGGNADPTRRQGTDPDFDGQNSYGDEAQANLRTVGQALVNANRLPAAALGLLPNSNVSRTGFLERDLVDYNTRSFKFNGALHYRLSEKVEAIAQVNYGNGTTVYTGNARYSLRSFELTQAKLELRGDNFTVRAYTTQERSGQSYAAGLVGVFMNEAIKPSAQWFGEYAGAFAQARQAGQAEAQAHLSARAFADQGRPQPGTAAFNSLYDTFRNRPISYTNPTATNPIDRLPGGGFLDKSNMYHAEAVYNFKNQIKFADVLIGGNFRQYELRSAGTLFADQAEGRTGSIAINEFGGFLQAAKSLFDNHLRLTGSIRYDKNQNFDGQFTPRVSAVATFGEQNFRLSYQTGFRIPTTQNQYIDLQTPNARLIGGLPEFFTRYNLANSYPLGNVQAVGTQIATTAQNPQFQEQQRIALTALVTAQATPQVTAAVTAAVTPVVTQQVTAGVTAAVTQQVTAGVTTLITQAVTQQVNAAVAAGQIAADAAAAAIQQGVAAQLALPATQATIQTQVVGALALPSTQATIQGQIAAVLPGVIQQQVAAALPGVVQSQVQANAPNFIQAQAVGANINQLQPYQRKEFKPERVASYEIGYRGIIGKRLFVDAYYYYSAYTNFIGGVILVQPTASIAPGLLPAQSGVFSGNTRRIFSMPANSSERITASGWAIGLDYRLGRGYNLTGNVANNELNNFRRSDEVNYASFNTPRYRYNLGLNNRSVGGSKFGFALAYRYQDAFTWEASFSQPSDTAVPFFSNTEVPAISNLDAQVSYRLSSIKSLIKVGGTNIGGNPYIQAFGNPLIGSTYYVSLTFDNLIR